MPALTTFFQERRISKLPLSPICHSGLDPESSVLLPKHPKIVLLEHCVSNHGKMNLTLREGDFLQNMLKIHTKYVQ